jgi:D-alanyl-D-alanine carboxypeptidase
MRTHHLMRTASISKLYAAALTMIYVERGELSLDDRLSVWLPHYARADEITIRMMLQHTSGLPDTFEQFGTLLRSGLRRRYIWKRTDLVKRHDGDLSFDPGTDFRYSNANYIFLGLVLEGITGQPVEQLLRREILEPLGLDETYFPPMESVPEGLVSGFDRDFMSFGAEHRPGQTSWSSLAYTSGALVASALDVARFTRALFAGEIVSGATLEKMQRFIPTRDAGDAWTGYGLGVVRAHIAGHEFRGHEGLFIGFEGYALHNVARGYDLTVMGNVSKFDVEAVIAALSERIEDFLGASHRITHS